MRVVNSGTAFESDPWVIFDIDGTLANIDHRLEHIANGLPSKEKDWEKFNSLMKDDSVNESIKELHSMAFDYGCNIAIITGRSHEYARQTISWLIKHNIYFCELHMRPKGDISSDYFVKQEIFDEYFKDKRDVLFVVEDRDRVVEMWRNNGLTCLQCQKGGY